MAEKIHEVAITEITIPEGTRPLEDVTALAESIDAIGLTDPIIITEDKRLVAGKHRIAAHELLGKTTILARMMTLDEMDAELVEIDTNLCRTDLPYYLRAKATLKRKRFYEARHPETRKGATAGAGKGKGSKPRVSDKLSFIQDAAKKTKKARRTIERDVAVAEGASKWTDKKLEAAVRGGSSKLDKVARSPTECRRLTKKPAEDQKTLLKMIESEEKGAPSRIKQADKQDQEAKNAAQATGRGKATVTLAEWRTWLPGQPQCDLLLTDPPYATDVDDVEVFANEWLPAALGKVKPTGRAYVCIGPYPDELHAYLMADWADMICAQVLVWTYRNTLGPTPKQDYKNNWQAILYFRGRDAGDLDCGIETERFAVQDINAPDGRQGDRYHTWQKPDELAERLIRHSTKPGDLILDPFTGTGTFLLAAKKLGRLGNGCDVDKDMVALAKKRGVRVA